MSRAISPKVLSLGVLAERLGATLHGDPGVEITGVAGIEKATAGQVTFVANPRYSMMAQTTSASAVIVDLEFPVIPTATLRLKNPYLAFAHAIELFYAAPAYQPGVHPTAVIHPTAKIGKGAHVGAYAVIAENVVIGDHATLLPHTIVYAHARIGSHFFAHAHAVVREHCRIGNHVMLQNGVVVGGDGFGFAKTSGGDWHKIVQSGTTTIEDWVEIQANACVDRASVGETTVGQGTKIDNLVTVGHGSAIGKNTLLCAQVGLAGSTNVGENVILAGQVGVAGHCTIGDNVVATAQSGIPNDVPAGKIVSGYPAIDNRQWLRSVALFNRLPELLKGLRRDPKKD